MHLRAGRFERPHKKGRGRPKSVSRVKNSNKTEKTSNLDIEAKEFVEEVRSSSRMSHGKQVGKGAVHTKGKFGDKK
jgi:hypothetical protein